MPKERERIKCEKKTNTYDVRDNLITNITPALARFTQGMMLQKTYLFFYLTLDECLNTVLVKS